MLGKKLLVADDSLTIQKVIKLALSNEGYEIQTVSDGQDALQQISLFRPDIVLVDVALPEKSAFEIKREVDEQTDLGAIRFILMSSAYEKVDEPAYKSLKFAGRLTKPFDPAHLRKVLNETLEFALNERREKTALTSRPSAPAPKPTPASTPSAPPPTTVPPPPSMTAMPLGTHDEDIRELTESTIKMSGLDDLQWSVQESAAKKPEPLKATPPPPPTYAYTPLATSLDSEPSLPPPPKMTDLGLTQFSLNESASDFGISIPSDAQDFPPSVPESAPSDYTQSAEPYQASESEFQTTLGNGSAEASVLPLTTGQMEELLKKQLQDTLERMAKKLLPDLAEKIIRQEINRLLNENAAER